MAEIALDELEKWYINNLNTIYDKHKKNLKKFLEKLENLTVDLKNSVNKMRDRKNEIDIDEKSERYMDRFYLKIKENLDTITIPENPMADDVSKFMDEIKRLFMNMHEAGKKNIRHFDTDFKIELKEIDMITRKMSEQMAKIDSFIRKKYATVKDAENLIKKIPRLQSLVERIANAKTTLDNLNGQKDVVNNELQDLENGILNIEQNPLYVELSKAEKELFKLRIKFDDHLKFSKALKKLRKKLETSRGFKGITPDQVRKYLTDPINAISHEGENHPQLTEFLVQLRFLLEHEGGTLQLKSEAKQKTLQNIDEIVSKGILKDNISQYNEITGKIESLKKELEKQDLSSRLDDLKEKVSLKTQEIEHMDGDIKHKTSEYRGLLEKLKEERDEIQEGINKFVGEDVKIQITLTY